MAIGLQIRETMSGTLTLNDGTTKAFAFALCAFTPRVFSFTVPRPFQGRLRFGDDIMPCQGELTLKLTGPRYRVDFHHPELGALQAIGNKRYGHDGWIKSLVTCPLTIYQGDKTIGKAEVAYRESILLFPFRALRLVPQERAFTGAMEVQP